jgi:DNA-binding MarR family transcriptional regulator
MTASRLAAAEAIQPQSLTRVLADLEEAGLISRQPDLADRRQVLIEITAAGRDLLYEQAKRRTVWLAHAMADHLSQTEQEVLRLAGQLMDRLADLPVEEGSAFENSVHLESL